MERLSGEVVPGEAVPLEPVVPLPNAPVPLLPLVPLPKVPVPLPPLVPLPKVPVPERPLLIPELPLLMPALPLEDAPALPALPPAPPLCAQDAVAIPSRAAVTAAVIALTIMSVSSGSWLKRPNPRKNNALPADPLRRRYGFRARYRNGRLTSIR